MKYYEYDPDSNHFPGLTMRHTPCMDVVALFYHNGPVTPSWRQIKCSHWGSTARREGDFPTLSSFGYLPVFSPRAWDFLSQGIDCPWEALPILDPRGRPFYVIHVMESTDCLDIERSLVGYRSPGELSRVYRFAFRTSQLKGKHFFKLPRESGGRIFFDDVFREVVEANKLKGLLFRELNMTKPGEKGGVVDYGLQDNTVPPTTDEAPAKGKGRAAASGASRGESKAKTRRVTRKKIEGMSPQELYELLRSHAEVKANPPARGLEIKKAQSALAFRLPPGYVEFLQQFNGGDFGYAWIMGVNLAEDYLDLLKVNAQMAPYIEGAKEGEVFPFARDCGGSYFCFDLRKKPRSGEYPVLYWNHEYAEQPEDAPYLWEEWSTDFVGFLRRVCIELHRP